MQFQLTREFLDNLYHAIDARATDWIINNLSELHAEDLSNVLYELDIVESKFVCDTLGDEISSNALTYIDTDTRKRFLKVFEPPRIAKMLQYIDSDDAADMLNEQPIQFREEIIKNIDDPQEKSYIRELLRYEPDRAGGLMAKELICAEESWTVQQTIEEIRRQAEHVDKIFTIYVIDEQEHLRGRVSLKKMILSEDHKKISDLMEEDIISVSTADPAEEVADIMRRYDLETVPVVDISGTLKGRITIDDVVDYIAAEAEYEQQIMSGLSADVEEDDTVWRLSKARLPWLLIGMVGGLAGARFIGLFEEDLAIIPAMAFFIPLITATGGNVGIQSSTLVVQSLADKSIMRSTIWERFGKMFGVAIINGIVLSGVVFLFNYLFISDIRLASVVSAALLSVVVLASFMGTVTPLVLDKFGINPAMASGPFITTANDLIGLGVYFSVAHVLYGL